MKTVLAFCILAALLGGCAIAPDGHGDRRDGYYQERGYTHSDDNHRDRNDRGGDGNYGDYRYRDGYESPADPFREHGN